MLEAITNTFRFSTQAKCKILLLLLLITIHINIKATDIVLEHYSISQGLSTSVVNDIYQDTYGFIWLGTDDGLNRFDGYSFKIYRNVINDSTSLSSSFVTKVFSDSQKRLWIGTVDGLNLYNPDCDCFKTIIPELSITAISEDIDGNIIVGSYGGIRIVESIDTEVKILTVGDGLPANSILRLFRNRKGEILCSTENHLFTYTHSSKTIKN
jgi:ligand-binding sensor domain-containing protein